MARREARYADVNQERASPSEAGRLNVSLIDLRECLITSATNNIIITTQQELRA